MKVILILRTLGSVVGIRNQDVDTRFGIVCQMPGRWVEKGKQCTNEKMILDHLPTIWVCIYADMIMIIDHAYLD